MNARPSRFGATRGRRGRGPLSSIVARTAPPTPSPGANGRTKASLPPAPPDAVELLGAMLDLRGSVELASMLDKPAPAPTPLSAELVELRGRMLDDLDAIVRGHDELDLRRMPRVPRLDPKTILAVLAETGALEAPRDPHLARAVRSLFSPVVDAAMRARTRGFVAVDDVVRDALPELAAASAVGTWLFRIDAVIERSSAAREEALVDRALASVEASFVRALAEAIAALPDDAAEREAAVAAWLEGDGVFARHLALAAAWVRGCVERRVTRLSAIANACGDASPAQPPGDDSNAGASS